MKLKEITPKKLQCGPSFGCPAIYKSNRKTIVVVGKRLSKKELRNLTPNKISADEEAVELAKEYFSGIK